MPRDPGRAEGDSGAKRREGLRTAGHYLTAAVLALKGYSKLEHPEGHRALIGVCFAAAANIVVVTALHPKRNDHAAKIEALVWRRGMAARSVALGGE